MEPLEIFFHSAPMFSITLNQVESWGAIGERIALLEAEEKAADESFREMLAGIPNLPHEIRAGVG